MKKLLLMIILSFITSLLGSVYAQEGFMNQLTDTKREIPLKNVRKGTSTTQGSGISRSPIIQPATASLSGNTITIDFRFPVVGATIIVTNINTGEVLYSDIYTTSGIVLVQLNVEIDADCRIDIIGESWSLQGEFPL